MRASIVRIGAAMLLIVGCQAPLSEPSQPPARDVDSQAADTSATAPLLPSRQTGPNGPLTLALDPIPARQGGQVQISARGFEAGEQIAFLASREPSGSDMMTLGGASASPQGTVDAIAVPLPEELASGPHAIQALGETSGRRSVGTLWIRARDPWLVLSTYDIQPLADLGFIAGGFEPQESVRVTLEARSDQPNAREPVEIAAIPTDQAGNSEWMQVKLPLVRAGTYSMVLHGVAGGLELRRELQIASLKPTAELSPWAGPPGVPLQLNAKGFAPNERIHVAFGGPTVEAAVVQADADGNLWGAGPVRVPTTALMGPLVVLLTGEDSGASARPEFGVLEPKPWLELTTWWGAPGVAVGFGGGGWIGGERVTFHVGSPAAPVAAEAQADDYGWLHTTGTATVPEDAQMDVTFVAVGEQSHTTAKATYSVVFPFDLRPRPNPATTRNTP
jgi:hypothetical protein